MLEQLERVLASSDFDASPRSRAFIRFIIEETLAGRQEALTQSMIATRVFERRDDFDPTVDPIVRIQAGRLRRSLERYYLLSGVGDPVRIELPRGTYVPAASWRAEGETAASEGRAGQQALVDPDGWPTVVVNLFEIGSPSPELEETATRLKELLCLEMGLYGDVRVVPRRQLGLPGRGPCEHGGFDLSGRISRVEGGLRVSACLLDCRSTRQLWAEEYQGAVDTVAFYEDAARRIAARVASEHGAVAKQLWAEQRHRPAGELLPYGAILRSYQFFFNREPGDFAPAVEALRRVVREQPECGLAWVQLSRLYVANYCFEVAPLDTPIDEAITSAQNGVHLDPWSQRARAALAGTFLAKGELAAGRSEAEKAYELNPESFVYSEWVGWLLALLGDWERGTALIRRSMERNPNHIPVALHALWADHLRKGEFEEAYQVALLFRDATFFWRALMRACCLGHLGRTVEAKLEVAELLKRKPDFASHGRALIGRHIRFPDLLERIVDGLDKAGLALD